MKSLHANRHSQDGGQLPPCHCALKPGPRVFLPEWLGLLFARFACGARLLSVFPEPVLEHRNASHSSYQPPANEHHETATVLAIEARWLRPRNKRRCACLLSWSAGLAARGRGLLNYLGWRCLVLLVGKPPAQNNQGTATVLVIEVPFQGLLVRVQL